MDCVGSIEELGHGSIMIKNITRHDNQQSESEVKRGSMYYTCQNMIIIKCTLHARTGQAA
jgi:hypothetical protein